MYYCILYLLYYSLHILLFFFYFLLSISHRLVSGITLLAVFSIAPPGHGFILSLYNVVVGITRMAANHSSIATNDVCIIIIKNYYLFTHAALLRLQKIQTSTSIAGAYPRD